MTFLALILALALRQFGGAEPWLHRDRWWQHYRERIAAHGLLDAVQLVLVLLPALILSLLLAALAPLLFGLPWILLAALVLLFSFGRGDFQALVAQYCGHCERGNVETGWLYLCDALGADDLALASGPGEIDDAYAQLQGRLLYEGYQRWFAVVLLFIVLGPAWAFAYRLLQLYAQQAAGPGAARVLFVVDWVPARLLGLTFALVGNFMHSRDAMRDALMDSSRDASAMLGAVGAAAAQTAADGFDAGTAADEARALGALLARSAVVWVLVIALVAIAG